MLNALKFQIDPEGNAPFGHSEVPEENATSGRLTIVVGEHLVTQGIDRHEDSKQDGPLVAGYPIAIWLAWNWWRLRWESPKFKQPNSSARSRDSVHDWMLTHYMTSIGEGYCWPDFSISSDGFLTELVWRPSSLTDTDSFYFFNREQSDSIPVSTFETAVDEFVSATLERLVDAGFKSSELHTLWGDLRAERADPFLTSFRRMEARMSLDPDEVPDEQIEQLMCEAELLGTDAFEELIAHPIIAAANAGMKSVEDVRRVAGRYGFHMDAASTVQVSGENLRRGWGNVPAWKVGVDAAHLIREQEGFDLEPLANPRLADLAGVPPDALACEDKSTGNLSFMYDEDGGQSHVAFRARWETGRRFDLARLLADRIFSTDDRLFPATRTFSYRQKVQRAFAAELLSPWDAVGQMMSDDESEEMKNDVAEHFSVSPLVIQNVIENNTY